MSNRVLEEQSCVPCAGGIPPLPVEEVTQLLAQLQEGWLLNKEGHLCRDYRFKNFKESMDFAHKIAEIAEKEGHHPHLTIAWGSCGVKVWTHKIQGLTENDFILAAKIDALQS